MSFVSVEFWIFLPTTLLVFFLSPPKNRWLVLLVASWFFYAYWSIDFLFLIFYVTLVAFLSGIIIQQCRDKSVRLKVTSIFVILLLMPLAWFKYAGFVATEISNIPIFTSGMTAFAQNVTLPIGISFFTFQAMSYTLDIYNKKNSPTLLIGDFALYISFFPQLIAGPIERSTRLLPQLQQLGKYPSELFAGFSYPNAATGCRLILLGLFKKLVIADNLAILVDMTHDRPELYGGSVHLIAAYFFAIQIYMDFSAYTDMARGIARIIGVNLMINFNLPYLARSIREFWQRWHISLTSWFRDYVYKPLGGNRNGPGRWAVTILLVFLASGLWHGAATTFILWGLIHGGLYLSEHWIAKQSPAIVKRIPMVVKFLITLHLVVITWIVFRAESLDQLLIILLAISQDIFSFGSSELSNMVQFRINDVMPVIANGGIIIALISYVFLEVVEYYYTSIRDTDVSPHDKDETVAVEKAFDFRSYAWVLSFALMLGIIFAGQFGQQNFIYFQF